MTTYHEQLEHAEKVIADAEAGAYDTELGITADERSALTKARNGDRITLADFRALTVLGEHALADQAHDDGRIDLTPNGDNS